MPKTCLENTFELVWHLKSSFEIKEFNSNLKLFYYAFLTSSWRFLRSNKLEQLEFKFEKNYWDLEKVFYKIEKKNGIGNIYDFQHWIFLLKIKSLLLVLL